MKYTEAMIAWTPSWAQDPVGRRDAPAGSIEVGPWPDYTGWSDRYGMTVGACFGHVHKMSAEGQAMMMFIDFHSAVVGYGVDPKAAHREFLKIDEYRKRIAPDIPGADPD